MTPVLDEQIEAMVDEMFDHVRGKMQALRACGVSEDQVNDLIDASIGRLEEKLASVFAAPLIEKIAADLRARVAGQGRSDVLH